MEIVKIYDELINESHQEMAIEKIVNFLDASYEPKIGIKRDEDFGEYRTEPVIVNKLEEENGEPVTKENLYDYLNGKFSGINPQFIHQVVHDWSLGKYKDGDYRLSKNIPM